MDINKAPGIRIDQIIIESFSFKKTDLLDISKPYSVNISVNNVVQLSDDTNKGRLLSNLSIVEQSGSLFELELSYGLYASVVDGEANMAITEFMKSNAPAIVYQFARETILTITQKAGIPLVIPPMNFSKALDDIVK